MAQQTERAVLVARVLELRRDFDALGDTPEDDRAAVRMADEVITVTDRLDELERQNKVKDLQTGIKSGKYQVHQGDGFDGGKLLKRTDPFGAPDLILPDAEIRSAALTGIESWDADDTLKEGASEVMEHADGRDTRGVAEHILRTSNPAYMTAFQKYMADPEQYRDVFTSEEREAWGAVREMSQRAALDISGAVLPSPLDPSIVLANSGVADPMRQLARVDQTTSSTKRYITSAGITASYDAELAEVSDDTPSLTEVTLTPEKAQIFAQASVEAAMDQPNIATEVAMMFADAKSRLDGNVFVNGTGTNQPVGIRVALAGGSSEINAAGEALVANDVYGLIEALPVRYRNNAQWQIELSTRNFIHRLWNPSGSEPPLIEGSNLVGTSFVLNSSVDPYSDVDDTATASNFVLLVGDWSNFIILDRIGMSIQFVPVLFNTSSNLPDGRSGWYGFYRTDSDSINDAAFRMLDVATTA